MKIQNIQKLAIKMGTESDFRGKAGVQKLLASKKQKFDKMSGSEKEEFDKESLENPYLDSGVYNIAENKEIKKVLVGIDIGPDEILIAKQLGNIDLVIAHHPVGKGLAQLADVMELQADVYSYGCVAASEHRDCRENAGLKRHLATGSERHFAIQCRS